MISHTFIKFFHELISSPITLRTVETGRVQVFIHLHVCLWYFMYTCVDAGVKEGAPKSEMVRDLENTPLMVTNEHYIDTINLRVLFRLRECSLATIRGMFSMSRTSQTVKYPPRQNLMHPIPLNKKVCV